MSNTAARRGLFVPSVLALGAFAVLVSLGTWQLERKAWKEALIATITERFAAPPAALPSPNEWSRLDAANHEFRRVSFRAEFVHDKEALVYATGSTLRSDAAGPGYWVFTPARLPAAGVVMVNRGFVPEGRRSPNARREGQISGIVDIVGVMRWPEAPSPFTPNNDPAKNTWFVRDPMAIAATRGVGAVAPFYIEQESPAVPGGWPHAEKLQMSLPNNHFGYALTWYGLAAVLAGVFGAWMIDRRRIGERTHATVRL